MLINITYILGGGLLMYCFVNTIEIYELKERKFKTLTYKEIFKILTKTFCFNYLKELNSCKTRTSKISNLEKLILKHSNARPTEIISFVGKSKHVNSSLVASITAASFVVCISSNITTTTSNIKKPMIESVKTKPTTLSYGGSKNGA